MSIETGVALLLIAACWAVAPAIICERMLRALDFGRGRGLIVGCLLGPLGVAAVNIYISLRGLSLNPARGGMRRWPPPLAARLWEPDRKFSMRGDLLAFVCLWAVIFLCGTLLPFDKLRRASNSPAGIAQTSFPRMQEEVAPIAPQATATAPTPSVESSSQPFNRTPQQERGLSESQKLTLLNEAQPITPPPAGSEANAAPGATALPAQPNSNTSAQSAETSAAASAGAAVPQVKPGGMSAGELMRLVVPSNFKAHGTISGSGRTTTLTIVCAECTYEIGTGRLRNAGTRATIKAAGVRVVVLMNGQDSWTFML
ncbi:MAG TPA: hypothetical protein VF656_02355 [Pyrinomonadaceae bacterium]|jgi:hypothetical protein